ncbi:membrane protein [Rugosimonospora acidiphila]|uniref:Membrane protein n=1 Tax=Rugosimonospora acidiphila TaxID=556531 RepID=A0ABP9RUR5_9ACTN
MRPSTTVTGTVRPSMRAKVPEITAMFWLIKVLTTGMGEAASDYLGTLSVILAGAIGIIGLVIALTLQLRARRYIAPVYWFAVAMVAVFGTMAADALHVALDIPYAGSTAFYAVALVVVFTLWRRAEGTLSIHSIVTRRREIYYWITVLVTFALGTAAGDLTAASMHLGYLTSAILFAALIALPAIGRRLGLDSIAAFWIAYVLTRPLGASIADWLGKPHHPDHGLGFGDGTVAALATLAIIVLVGYVTVARAGIQPDVEPATVEV